MSQEEKVLVALASGQFPGDPPTVILGMTPETIKVLERGQTHTFDLRKAGVPVQIIIFHGEDQADVIEKMQAGAAAAGAPFEDKRGKGKLPDLGIDDPSVQ